MSVFYDQPQLADVLAVLALRPALMSLRSPGMPRLKRAMNYRAVFADEFCITSGGTGVSILCSFLWPSVRAIVAGTIAGAIAGIAVSYVLCPELPTRRDPEICRELWKFGAQVLVNTLVMALWMNIDRLLELKLLPEKQMRLYAVGWNLAAVAEMIMIRASDVHFSMLSRLPANTVRRMNHDRLMRILSLWLAPTAAILICAAPWVIELLYDARYADARPVFLILMCRVLIRGDDHYRDADRSSGRDHPTVVRTRCGVTGPCRRLRRHLPGSVSVSAVSYCPSVSRDDKSLATSCIPRAAFETFHLSLFSTVSL